jgi:hypothetical protein
MSPVCGVVGIGCRVLRDGDPLLAHDRSDCALSYAAVTCGAAQTERFWNSCCRLLNLSSEVVTRCQSPAAGREIIDGQRAMQNQFPVHRRIMLYRSIFKVREPMRDRNI